MREDDALFGEYINSLHERFGDEWEEVTGQVNDRAPTVRTLRRLTKDRITTSFAVPPAFVSLPAALCDDCLLGCHKHCGDPVIGAEPCECTDAEHDDGH